MNEKKGFTLIEIVLSIGILSIIMVMFMTVMITSTKVTAKSIVANKESLTSQAMVEGGDTADVEQSDAVLPFKLGGVEFDTNIKVKKSKDDIKYTVFEYKKD